MLQGNSPQARSIAGALSQKLQQLKNGMQDALVNQVGQLQICAADHNFLPRRTANVAFSLCIGTDIQTSS